MGNRNISQYFPMTNHVPGSIIKIIIDFVRIHFGEDFEKMNVQKIEKEAHG